MRWFRLLVALKGLACALWALFGLPVAGWLWWAGDPTGAALALAGAAYCHAEVRQ